MNRLIEYILSDAFEQKINTVAVWVVPFFGAIMVARVLKFIVEFILFPASFH